MSYESVARYILGKVTKFDGVWFLYLKNYECWKLARALCASLLYPSPGLIGLIKHDSNATSPKSSILDNGFLPIQNYKQLVNKCQVSQAGFILPLPEYILLLRLSRSINTVVPLLENMLCLQGFNKTHQRRYNILATEEKFCSRFCHVLIVNNLQYESVVVQFQK